MISTTNTTALKISNNDSSAPDEKIQIRRLGLYTLPDVQMEAKQVIETNYYGMGYNFSLKDGKWLFEKTSGSDNSNSGDYYTLPIDSGN